MASAARGHFDQTQTQPSAAGTFLVQLKEAHQQLLEQMINLRDMTLGPLPDDAVLADARWRIGQASLRRRSLAASIFDFLSTRVDGHDFRSLRTLRLEDQMLLRCSVQHVSTWTSASILMTGQAIAPRYATLGAI